MFYQFEWNDKVIDINEQYPLLPIGDTIRLAEQMGISYPAQYHKKRRARQPDVMHCQVPVRCANSRRTAPQFFLMV